MFVTYDISWYDEVDESEPVGSKIYPFSPEYTRGAFKIEYERCKDFYKSSGVSLNSIEWLAQYAFCGGIPPYKGEEPHAEGFGPAICMWKPDDWAFDPSFTDYEVQDLGFRRFDSHDIEILEELAVGLDEDGEIVRTSKLEHVLMWTRLASGRNGWENFEVYFTHLDGFDLRYRTSVGFHSVRNDNDLPDIFLEDWIFIRNCSPINTGLSAACELEHSQLSDQGLRLLSSEQQSTNSTTEMKRHLSMKGQEQNPADEIDTGTWDAPENFPEHLQSASKSSQSDLISYTPPNPRSPWNTGLGTVLLAPAPDTQLLGFETTKLRISSHTQQPLKSNRCHELSNLEQLSQARILIFGPCRAQDGRVSDIALVFIQGSPYARHQAVKVLTAFQANSEKGSMESNVNFMFLVPSHSRRRKVK
ncbi:uncharacterized protein Bfra_006251 [Botrytis fragariae]|uniref:Uncharacterized protein n=1 Tax=Botrytis fragariae TaxID=1964551 RepID=A0A8H6ENU1_9HELO|nr:uncharacterized protein Bfra_006251 [Botrytis fragariae]KAF5879047.1 hypothetical protein Bfra_006251 [Botrytis fragariae]